MSAACAVIVFVLGVVAGIVGFAALLLREAEKADAGYWQDKR